MMKRRACASDGGGAYCDVSCHRLKTTMKKTTMRKTTMRKTTMMTESDDVCVYVYGGACAYACPFCEMKMRKTKMKTRKSKISCLSRICLVLDNT